MIEFPPEEATSPQQSEPRRRAVYRRSLLEAELIDEIIETAERIVAARHLDGELVARTDSRWRLLRAIELSHYCLSISDVARELRIPKQRAHELVTAAARGGDVDVVPNPDDRRIRQVLLTNRARSKLAGAHRRRSFWTATLLSGLGGLELGATVHIMRVIRQRLLRDERQFAAANPGRR